MDLTCEERPSDSPLVERVWRRQSEHASAFTSIAASRSELVVTKFQGRTTVTMRGPESGPTPAFCPAGAEYVGIQFRPGVFVDSLPMQTIMDRADRSLPAATARSFWLCGSAWHFPDYDNADTFVGRLVRDGALVCDPLVATVLQGRQPADISLRTVQRRFLLATGLAQAALHQIDRARYATALLKQGVSILDVVFAAGYYDQPHLTRSLKRFVGLTPAQVADAGRVERLSLLYKTTPPATVYAEEGVIRWPKTTA